MGACRFSGLKERPSDKEREISVYEKEPDKHLSSLCLPHSGSSDRSSSEMRVNVERDGQPIKQIRVDALEVEKHATFLSGDSCSAIVAGAAVVHQWTQPRCSISTTRSLAWRGATGSESIMMLTRSRGRGQHVCAGPLYSSRANLLWPQAKLCIRLSSGLPGELGISKAKDKDFVETVPVNTQPISFHTCADWRTTGIASCPI